MSLINDNSVKGTKIKGNILKLKPLTTTERDNIVAEKGMVIFNSTTNTLQYFNGTIWV